MIRNKLDIPSFNRRIEIRQFYGYSLHHRHFLIQPFLHDGNQLYIKNQVANCSGIIKKISLTIFTVRLRAGHSLKFFSFSISFDGISLTILRVHRPARAHTRSKQACSILFARPLDIAFLMYNPSPVPFLRHLNLAGLNRYRRSGIRPGKPGPEASGG